MKSETTPRCAYCGHKIANHKPASKPRRFGQVTLRCTVPLSTRGPVCSCKPEGHGWKPRRHEPGDGRGRHEVPEGGFPLQGKARGNVSAYSIDGQVAEWSTVYPEQLRTSILGARPVRDRPLVRTRHLCPYKRLSLWVLLRWLRGSPLAGM